MTATPAAMLGVQGVKGSLDAGADADLVVLSEEVLGEGRWAEWWMRCGNLGLGFSEGEMDWILMGRGVRSRVSQAWGLGRAGEYLDCKGRALVVLIRVWNSRQ